MDTTQASTRGGSRLGGFGNFLSVSCELLRERVFAHYFGTSDVSDALKVGMKVPILLQSLLSEGALSAALMKVYARARAERDEDFAKRMAWSMGGVLALLSTGVTLVAVFFTPALFTLIAPGFTGPKRELSIEILRIIFPSASVLVLSGWCFGILLTHRRYFIAYATPALFNLSIVGVILILRIRHDIEELAVDVAWGLFIGSVVQFLVQFSFSVRLVGLVRNAFTGARSSVRETLKSSFPGMMSRGVPYLNVYTDSMLASYLPTGGVSALSYAQTLYLLPLTFSGMIVIEPGEPEHLRHRLEIALTRMGFVVIPSVVAFILLGDILAGAVFQSGDFRRTDSLLCWGILAGAALALVPAARSRILVSALGGFDDQPTALRAGVLRITFSVALGIFTGLFLPGMLGIARIYGTAGITVASSLAAWLEYAYLRRRLETKMGKFRPGVRARNRAWTAATIAGCMAFAAKIGVGDLKSPFVIALVVLALYVAVYCVIGALLGLEEARRICGRIGLRFS